MSRCFLLHSLLGSDACAQSSYMVLAVTELLPVRRAGHQPHTIYASLISFLASTKLNSEVYIIYVALSQFIYPSFLSSLNAKPCLRDAAAAMCQQEIRKQLLTYQLVCQEHAEMLAAPNQFLWQRSHGHLRCHQVSNLCISP